MVVDAPLAPPTPVTCRVTVYAPGSVKVCGGLISVDVVPSPKFHACVSARRLWSTNHTPSGAGPRVTWGVNAAVTGGAAPRLTATSRYRLTSVDRWVSS